MTDINKLICGFVDSLDEEDLEYLRLKIEQKLDTLTRASYTPPEYEIFCLCGHKYCSACGDFKSKFQNT